MQVTVINKNNKMVYGEKQSRIEEGDIFEVEPACGHRYILITHTVMSGSKGIAYATPVSEYTRPSLKQVEEITEYMSLEIIV